MSEIRHTKIIVTLGRNSSSKEVLKQLIWAGMDIARISNRFLNITREEVIRNLKAAVRETGIEVGIMLGLRESDLRFNSPTEEILNLKKG